VFLTCFTTMIVVNHPETALPAHCQKVDSNSPGTEGRVICASSTPYLTSLQSYMLGGARFPNITFSAKRNFAWQSQTCFPQEDASSWWSWQFYQVHFGLCKFGGPTRWPGHGGDQWCLSLVIQIFHYGHCCSRSRLLVIFAFSNHSYRYSFNKIECQRFLCYP
jgi:hypothetical protein